MIRIVAGSLKGRTLIIPSSFSQRPTLGRIRESIFNILKSRIVFENYGFVDLFSGSGAVGIEAYSQGFQKSLLIESDKKNSVGIQKNLKEFKAAQENISVLNVDALHWLKNQSLFDLPTVFFIDPPYQTNLYEAALHILLERKADNKEHFILIEKDIKKKIEFDLKDIIQHKKYGSTEIILAKLS